MKIINEFCLVKDKKIECVLIKSDNKTSLSPLVLLHEGLGSIEMWKDWPTKLALRTKMNLVLYSVLYALKYITNNLTIIVTVYEAFINSLEYT